MISLIIQHAAHAVAVGSLTREELRGAARCAEQAGDGVGASLLLDRPNVGTHQQVLIAVEGAVVVASRQQGEAGEVGAYVGNPMGGGHQRFSVVGSHYVLHLGFRRNVPAIGTDALVGVVLRGGIPRVEMSESFKKVLNGGGYKYLNYRFLYQI